MPTMAMSGSLRWRSWSRAEWAGMLGGLRRRRVVDFYTEGRVTPSEVDGNLGQPVGHCVHDQGSHVSAAVDAVVLRHQPKCPLSIGIEAQRDEGGSGHVSARVTAGDHLSYSNVVTTTEAKSQGKSAVSAQKPTVSHFLLYILVPFCYPRRHRRCARGACPSIPQRRRSAITPNRLERSRACFELQPW